MFGGTQKATQNPMTEMRSLRCTATKGTFPHEVDVAIQGADGAWYESLMDSCVVFVDGALSMDEEKEGNVQVVIIHRAPAKKSVLVELPRQVVGGGRRIWVSENDVK